MSRSVTAHCNRSSTGGKPTKLRSQILPGLSCHTTFQTTCLPSTLWQWTEHRKQRQASEQWERVLTLCYQMCVRTADSSVKNDSQVTHTQAPTVNPAGGSSSNLCFHFSYTTCSQPHASTVGAHLPVWKSCAQNVGSHPSNFRRTSNFAVWNGHKFCPLSTWNGLNSIMSTDCFSFGHCVIIFVWETESHHVALTGL